MNYNRKANRSEERTLLTLEERLGMAERSQAASPEAAASLLQRLLETLSVNFFCGSKELDRLYRLLSEYIEQIDEDIFWYGGLCRSFRLARDDENASFQSLSREMPPAEERNPYRPAWGFQLSNALVVLGLMLLDHAKGQMKNKEIYHCMRMTLGQYLDALVDISFREDGTLDLERAEEFRILREVVLVDYDASKPLGEALADILRYYIAAWREFDHLNYILDCMRKLSTHLEQEKLVLYVTELNEEEKVECLDVKEHYFNLACRYPEDVPDPSSKDIAQGALYDKLFLLERDYRPNTLREIAAKTPSMEMQALLEENICEERLAYAMREIDRVVSDLYALFVDPYLQMREYHYEGHLEP